MSDRFFSVADLCANCGEVVVQAIRADSHTCLAHGSRGKHWFGGGSAGDRDILIAILRRIEIMSADLSQLTLTTAAIEQTIGNIAPVLQANVDTNTQVIGAVEQLLAEIAQLGGQQQPSQSDVDALNQRLQAVLGSLSADLGLMNQQNLALQAELLKTFPAPTTPAPPTPAPVPADPAPPADPTPPADPMPAPADPTTPADPTAPAAPTAPQAT